MSWPGNAQSCRARFEASSAADGWADTSVPVTASSKQDGIQPVIGPPYALQPLPFTLQCQAARRIVVNTDSGRSLHPPLEPRLRAAKPGRKVKPARREWFGGELFDGSGLGGRGTQYLGDRCLTTLLRLP